MFIVNSVREFLATQEGWAVALLGAVIATLLAKLILKILVIPLRRMALSTTSIWDDVGVDVIEGAKTPVLFVGAFFLFAKGMKLSQGESKALLTAVVAATVFQVCLWGLYVIRRWRDDVLIRRVQNDPSAASAMGLLSVGMQTSFIVAIILIGLSNLGIDIGALLAGLGVGGIAVALAAQNILGDLLASLSIVLDKPFIVGDFIVVGSDHLGTVENIGIKTTRLRSLSGEELIFSNKDLLESRIRNYKRMWERRVVHKIGVTYSTPAELLDQIPVWIRSIIEQHEKLRFDRCHFSGYGSSSLDYEFVFWVKDPDYNVFMDIQQKILISLYRKFAEAKVEFAFPTQTILVEKLPALQSHGADGRTQSHHAPAGLPS